MGRYLPATRRRQPGVFLWHVCLCIKVEGAGKGEVLVSV